jgi:hypothetical protein
MRFPLMLALALTACSPKSTLQTEHYSGFIEVGEHGPVFIPNSDLKPDGQTREIIPWRLSFSEGALDEKLQSVLAGKPFGTVVMANFIGRELPYQSDGDGFERKIEVGRWIQLRRCRTTQATFTDCVRR